MPWLRRSRTGTNCSFHTLGVQADGFSRRYRGHFLILERAAPMGILLPKQLNFRILMGGIGSGQWDRWKKRNVC